MLGYLSTDIICSKKETVFRECSSRKTVSYEEQIMSKDKYPSIFSPQMETIVLIILQIFFATRAVLKIGEYSRIFPSFSWEIFGHVTRLDQSRASEKIWWIIMTDILPQRNQSDCVFATSVMWIYVNYFCTEMVSTVLMSSTPRRFLNFCFICLLNPLVGRFKIFQTVLNWKHAGMRL